MPTTLPGITFEAVDFDPFVPSIISVPATVEQQEIFTSIQIGGDAANCAFNESVTLRIRGPLDAALLRQAFAEVVQRHEATRATFSEDGASFRVADRIDLPWVESTAATPDEGAAQLAELIGREALKPFDLSRGPLIRLHLLKIGETDHALIVSGHHLICDGWSLSLIIRDLSQAYSALVTGQGPAFEPALSFCEYARQQVAYHGGKEYQEVEAYWLKQFSGEIPVVEFPIDNARPARRGFHARRIDVPVPPTVVSGLRQLSRTTKTSLVMIMLSAFEAFLYRVSGQRDLVVGLPSAGQSATGNYNLVGHCVNLLPLTTHIDPTQSFAEYLKGRRAYLLDAYDHQRFTFGSLLQKLNIPRDPSRIPLVPVVFNVDLGFTEGFHFEGCEFSISTNPRFFENFEVFVNASGDGDGMTLECTFNNDLFNRTMMQLRMEEFVRVLEGIVSAPASSIAQLPVVTAEEEARFGSLNATDSPQEAPFGIHEHIAQITTQHGHTIAVAAGAETLTYVELMSRADRYAAQLQSLGLCPGAVVGVCLPRSVELPAVLLGILKAGAVYMPLDPDFPADRLHYMMGDSQAPLVVTTDALQARLGFDPTRVVQLDTLQRGGGQQPVQTSAVSSETLAYILYTSGSTGQPKGIAVRHAAVTNLLADLGRNMQIGMGTKLLAVTTISFDISVLELFMPLMHGALVRIATKEEAIDPRWIAQTITEEHIDFVQATPATYEMLFLSGWSGHPRLSVLCGGEALRIELAEKLISGCREVWNLYGPTETTIWSTAERMSFGAPIRARNGICSIGKPVANTRVFVMDEFGQPCPLGVSGELWIGGEGLSAGYLNRPELNAEKFVAAPDGKGRVFRTGDRVQTDLAGALYFLNRFDHQLKIRGFRIEAGEVETALNDCPNVRQSVVMGQPDGNGQTILAAWLLCEDSKLADGTLIEGCRAALCEKLPEYMIPSAWKRMTEWPLTPNGKINRKALPPPLQAEPTKPTGTVHEEMTAMQLKVHALWKDILKVAKIGLDDNFFNLGGHSILAVKLMIELEKLTGKKLPLAVLFSSSTIRELSALLEDPTDSAVWDPVVPFRTSGSRQPVYFAHGISGNVFKYHALALRLSEDQPGYGLQAYGLNGTDKPFTSMQEMAAYHVAAIRNRQPKGPYHLAGGSFGGYLAYEMAVQLRAAGEHVGFLCLCDIEACKIQDFLPTGVKELVDAALFSTRFIKRAAELALASKEDRASYFAERKQRSQGKLYDSWLDKHKMAELIGHESTAFFQQVEEACYTALMSYKIPAYDGDVLLIRAKQGNFNNEYAYDLGWSNFVKGKVEVASIPGDHNTIFWQPNVEELARCIDGVLRRHPA